MKKPYVYMIIIASFAMAAAAGADTGEIRIGKGTLNLGAILQAGYTFHVEDNEGFDSFWINRARFLFSGTIIPNKVKYFVQTETKGEVSLLDYKARLYYLPKTEIAVGRFLPNFTLYMPNSTGRLEMINYPLTTARYAPWRQIGIQTTTTTEYVDFNVGIFNGADQPNNTADNNDAKDFLFRVDFKPPIERADIRAGGYLWVNQALPVFVDTEADIDTTMPNKTMSNTFFGGFIRADYSFSEQVTAKFRGEYMAISTEELYAADIDSVASIDRRAFFVHLGVSPHKILEILGRFDYNDPDKDIEDNAESWLTGGINYYLEGHNAMLYLNYIHKMEEGEEIDNDLLTAQIQIMF